MSFDELDSFIVHEHFHQSCPRDSCTATVLVLALYSIVRQPRATLFWENVSAGTLKVKHFAIEGIIMWITTNGAGTSLHRLAGELKWSTTADLWKGAGLTDTLQACWGAGALLCTGCVTPEWVSKLHRIPFERNKNKGYLKGLVFCYYLTIELFGGIFAFNFRANSRVVTRKNEKGWMVCACSWSKTIWLSEILKRPHEFILTNHHIPCVIAISFVQHIKPSMAYLLIKYPHCIT